MNDWVKRAVSHWTLDMREEYEERAAIIEFCANIPREQAERRAFDEIRKRKSPVASRLDERYLPVR